MICPNCRHPVEDGSTFCPHCDYNFPVASAERLAPEKYQTKEKKKPNQVLWTIVIFAFVLLVALPLKNRFMPKDETKSQSNTAAVQEESFEPLQIGEDFTVTEFKTSRSLLSVTVEGTIKNTGSNDFSFVSISFAFYDDKGNKIDDKTDTISGLKAGETWKFQITGPTEAASTQCSDFNAF